MPGLGDGSSHPLTPASRFLKRFLDLGLCVPALVLSAPLLALLGVVARWETGASGIFSQERMGRGGQRFRLHKIRTMRLGGPATHVTVLGDPRVTRFGGFLRRFKLDELPQLWNVVVGDMSLVGPRPDMPELYEGLAEEDRIILAVRPGVTGPATLRFRDEERLLQGVPDPDRYNEDVLFPAKVRLNREYVLNYRVRGDIKYLIMTITGVGGGRVED